MYHFPDHIMGSSSYTDTMITMIFIDLFQVFSTPLVKGLIF